jgi:hypothetical protein
MKENPAGGIPLDDFIALLRGAFNEGAKPLKHTDEADKYPLNKYQKNIDKLAKKWPHADCARALYCAYQAGQKAKSHAKQNHPGTDTVDEPSMQQACDDLEHVARRTRGPVCAD